MAKKNLFTLKNIIILFFMIITLSVSVFFTILLTIRSNNVSETKSDNTYRIVSLDPMIISLSEGMLNNLNKSIPILKINVGIKTISKNNAEILTNLKPKIRNVIIDHISKKSENNLNSNNIEIKNKQISILKEEIKSIIRINFIPSEKNPEVFFSEFFIQP